MIEKKVLDTARVRKIPKQFGFVDHRLVRDAHIDRLSCQSAALYLFLITVSDKEGLSYYGDRSVEKRLQMKEGELLAARLSLVQTGLIAFAAPIYQVLSLDPPSQSKKRSERSGSGQGPLAIGEILKTIAKGGSS
jgi:hypothetical protein